MLSAHRARRLRPCGARGRAAAARFACFIAGAGVAALEAALALRVLAEERITLELLAPESHFW